MCASRNDEILLPVEIVNLSILEKLRAFYKSQKCAKMHFMKNKEVSSYIGGQRWRDGPGLIVIFWH